MEAIKAPPVTPSSSSIDKFAAAILSRDLLRTTDQFLIFLFAGSGMASQQSNPAPLSAQVVAKEFVHQFYYVVHHLPEHAHCFYQESSKLGRPGVQGEMSTVSTLEAIDEKILSMGYNECQTEIKTVDAQESLGGGVIVIVTGFLSGKDNLKKEFMQTFFLAPQENGYYVLNDIFRYVEDADQQQEEEEFNADAEADASVVSEHDSFPLLEDIPQQAMTVLVEDELFEGESCKQEEEFNADADASVFSEHEHIPQQAMTVLIEDEVFEGESCKHSEHEDGSAVEGKALEEEVICEDPEKEVINEVLEKDVIYEVPEKEVINEDSDVALNNKFPTEEVNVTDFEEEANGEVPVEEANCKFSTEEVNSKVPVEEVNRKGLIEAVNKIPVQEVISVIQIGHEHKKSYASIVKLMKENRTPLSVPTLVPTKMAPVNVKQQVVSTQVLSHASDINGTVSKNSIAQDLAVDSCSIYIKNLPLSASPAQLEEGFRKFGSIKPDGIQVRTNKQQGFCFGFVEFEAASALQSALEASPIMIGNRQAYVQKKWTNGSRVNNRGRFQPSRWGGFRGDGMRGPESYGGGRGNGRGDYNYRELYT